MLELFLYHLLYHYKEIRHFIRRVWPLLGLHKAQISTNSGVLHRYLQILFLFEKQIYQNPSTKSQNSLTALYFCVKIPQTVQKTQKCLYWPLPAPIINPIYSESFLYLKTPTEQYLRKATFADYQTALTLWKHLRGHYCKPSKFIL